MFGGWETEIESGWGVEEEKGKELRCLRPHTGHNKHSRLLSFLVSWMLSVRSGVCYLQFAICRLHLRVAGCGLQFVVCYLLRSLFANVCCLFFVTFGLRFAVCFFMFL